MAPTYCSHILYLLTPVCFGKKLVPMIAIPAVTMREVGFSRTGNQSIAEFTTSFHFTSSIGGYCSEGRADHLVIRRLVV